MHLTFVYSALAATSSVYVDGVLASDRSYTFPAAPCGSGLPSQIGAWDTAHGSNIRFLDGRLDEMRIYDRALGPDEVEELSRLIFTDGFESGDVSVWSSGKP